MVPKPRRRILASLDLIPFARTSDAPAWLVCLLSPGPLQLNQPDLRSPEHLIGGLRGLSALAPDPTGAGRRRGGPGRAARVGEVQGRGGASSTSRGRMTG